MNPDTPQSGKRAGKSGARTGGSAESAQGFDSTTPTPSQGERPAPTGASTSSDVVGGANREGGDGRPASRLIDQVKDKATSEISAQKDRATAGIGSVADAVRQTSQQLRENRHDAVAQVVESAAAQLERFSEHLRNRSLHELVDDAQRLARQQPAIFIGTSFAAGLVAARFIKASSPSRGEEWRGGDNREDWRDLSGRSSESVYGGGMAGSGDRPSSDTSSGSFNTGDRPGTGDVQGRGGL
jgi:hypothetical protein